MLCNRWLVSISGLALIAQRQVVGQMVLTTMRASEATLDVTAKNRHGVREAKYDGRNADPNTEGTSLDAIVVKVGRNGF